MRKAFRCGSREYLREFALIRLRARAVAACPGRAVGTFSKGRAGSPATDVGPPPPHARREMPGAPRGQHLAGGRLLPSFFPTGPESGNFKSLAFRVTSRASAS